MMLGRLFADEFNNHFAFETIDGARRYAGEVLGRTIEHDTNDAKMVDEAVELYSQLLLCLDDNQRISFECV